MSPPAIYVILKTQQWMFYILHICSETPLQLFLWNMMILYSFQCLSPFLSVHCHFLSSTDVHFLQSADTSSHHILLHLFDVFWRLLYSTYRFDKPSISINLNNVIYLLLLFDFHDVHYCWLLDSMYSSLFGLIVQSWVAWLKNGPNSFRFSQRP